MDLNQLLYRRLSQDNLLNGTLSKYADKPAIFNTEFPPDQQEGWNGKSQYPRISYVFNKQVDTKRSSSGQLTVALYDIMDPLEVEKMEVAIRNCLQDVVMRISTCSPLSALVKDAARLLRYSLTDNASIIHAETPFFSFRSFSHSANTLPVGIPAEGYAL